MKSHLVCLLRAVRMSATKTRWNPGAVQVTGAMTALVSFRPLKKNSVVVCVELCLKSVPQKTCDVNNHLNQINVAQKRMFLSDYLTHFKWHLVFPSFCEGRYTEGIFWLEELDRNLMWLQIWNANKGKRGFFFFFFWKKMWKNITIILSFPVQKILKEC